MNKRRVTLQSAQRLCPNCLVNPEHLTYGLSRSGSLFVYRACPSCLALADRAYEELRRTVK